MPTEPEPTAPQTQTVEPQEPTPPQQPATSAVPTSWEDVFKHPRFKELNERARKAEETLRTQQEAALKEQNKYKELYEQRENELKTERMNNLRLRIATQKGLPVELVDRLRGETEEEMTKDADTLLTLVKPAQPQTPPGVPPIKGGGSTTLIDVTKEIDPAKVREAYRKGQVK